MRIEFESADLSADEIVDNIEDVRDKVHSFKRTRLIIKVLGVLGMFIALFMSYWLAAILLWILFFPDANDFVKFFKNIKFK